MNLGKTLFAQLMEFTIALGLSLIPTHAPQRPKQHSVKAIRQRPKRRRSALAPNQPFVNNRPTSPSIFESL